MTNPFLHHPRWKPPLHLPALVFFLALCAAVAFIWGTVVALLCL